jgi:hypothetical protein
MVDPSLRDLFHPTTAARFKARAQCRKKQRAFHEPYWEILPLTCHPERREGSAFTTATKQILRVAQDDMRAVHDPWPVSVRPIQAARNDNFVGGR